MCIGFYMSQNSQIYFHEISEKLANDDITHISMYIIIVE